MTDSDLLAQLLNNDARAFEILVTRYQDFVVRTAFAYLKNFDDANDVAQNVFVSVYENISRFRGDANLKTWICRITINKAINELRRKKVRSVFQGIGNLWGNKTFDAPDPDNPHLNLQTRQQNKLIEKAFELLPENQKTAFVLHKIDDLPQQEIAEIMGISVSAVESLVHRAKQNLQKKLAAIVKNE